MLKAILFSLAILIVPGALHADDWPQWLGPQRDSVWREDGIVEKFPDGGPKIRWRTPISAGYSGPAVANGFVYITDRVLDPGAKNPAKPFDRPTIPGKERVLCLNESDGKVVWTHEYECAYDISFASGPRATPLVSSGKVYTLGAEGNLYCLDAENGSPLWSHDFQKEFGATPPMWGYAAHPLLDQNKLICMVGGKDDCTVVAFEKDGGKEIWRAVKTTQLGYCPPMMIEAGGTPQLIVWHGDALVSLDPESGNQYWSQPFAVKAGLAVPTPRKFNDMLLVSSFYNGSMMMKLDPQKPAAKVLWKGKGVNEHKTDTLHSIIATPFIENGYIYGCCSYGQFRCLKAESGERVWESFVPTGGKEERWANAFIVKNGSHFFLANEKGDLIIANLSPKGYEELSRAHLIEPTNQDAGRAVVWSHPAFANRCIYLRNDKEIICASLAK